ncbi:MAG: NUDIX hydrolase [Micromonosporaceae bacterium]
MPGVADPLGTALHLHRPASEAEATDLRRVRDVLSGDPWSRSSPLHVTGSAIVVHPATRRVLLRWHVRMQAWLQVGGHGDPGETDPLVVARREGREETGLDDLVPWPPNGSAATMGHPILHLVIVPVPPARGEPAHEHADIRYLLATESPESARPEGPAAELRWLSIEDAYAEITEPNLAETLRRAAALLH